MLYSPASLEAIAQLLQSPQTYFPSLILLVNMVGIAARQEKWAALQAVLASQSIVHAVINMLARSQDSNMACLAVGLLPCLMHDRIQCESGDKGTSPRDIAAEVVKLGALPRIINLLETAASNDQKKSVLFALEKLATHDCTHSVLVSLGAVHVVIRAITTDPEEHDAVATQFATSTI